MHLTLAQDGRFLGPLPSALHWGSQLVSIDLGVVALFDVIECLVLTLKHFAAIQQHPITVTIIISAAVLDYILHI